jgi:hypothetical protein
MPPLVVTVRLVQLIMFSRLLFADHLSGLGFLHTLETLITPQFFSIENELL